MTTTPIRLVDATAVELRDELARHLAAPSATRLVAGPPDDDVPAVLVGAAMPLERGELRKAAGVVLLAPTLVERDTVQLALAGQDRVWLEIVTDPAVELLAERTLELLLNITTSYPVSGSDVGLLGFRAVGWRLAYVLHALDANVLYWSPESDPRVIEEERIHAMRSGARRVEFDELLRASDALIVDVSDDPGAQPFIGRAEFALMRDDALLVNTMSATAIDDGALIQALRGGYLRGVALGRTNLEPLPAGSPLHAIERVRLSTRIHPANEVSPRRMLARRAAQTLALRPELGVELRRVRHVSRHRQGSATRDNPEAKGQS